MIEFESVSKVYGDEKPALSQITFQIPKGELVYINGHSGAGKSTLLKLVAAIERPTSGRVLVGGLDVGKLRPKAVPMYRRRLGLIFQTPKLLTNQSVSDNVALPLVIAGYTEKELERRVRAALDKVGLLSKAHLPPQALSGGEQQRVGIARAIVHRPAVLLADEPTGNLDPHLSLEIMSLFEQFNQLGVTVLIATHDQYIQQNMPYRTITLEHGRMAGALHQQETEYHEQA